MELGTKCAKICPRENVAEGLMSENLAARKYVRSQYMILHVPIISADIKYTQWKNCAHCMELDSIKNKLQKKHEYLA